jgi:3-isopropylmalate/(R)-2-methylmalate dehydratase small subunit
MLKPFTTFTSNTLILSQADIDTDQIIPARFLTATTKEGFGKNAFYDWRYDEQGSMNDHVLNNPETAQQRIIVAGHNFGCGSSREHAPWALTDYGFRAVIRTEIADLFRSNALKNGLLPIIVGKDVHATLLAKEQILTIDLGAQIITCEDGSTIAFDVEPFAKLCLMDGIDQLGYLLSKKDEISAYGT